MADMWLGLHFHLSGNPILRKNEKDDAFGVGHRSQPKHHAYLAPHQASPQASSTAD
jgi:hypothetical protein